MINIRYVFHVSNNNNNNNKTSCIGHTNKQAIIDNFYDLNSNALVRMCLHILTVNLFFLLEMLFKGNCNHRVIDKKNIVMYVDWNLQEHIIPYKSVENSKNYNPEKKCQYLNFSE